MGKGSINTFCSPEQRTADGGVCFNTCSAFRGPGLPGVLEGYCCAMCTELARGKSRANFPPTPRFLTNILGRAKVLTFGVTKNTALLRLKV